MTSEMASTCRQIGQEINLRNIIKRFSLIYDPLGIDWRWTEDSYMVTIQKTQAPSSHSLSSIRRFKGLT